MRMNNPINSLSNKFKFDYFLIVSVVSFSLKPQIFQP